MRSATGELVLGEPFVEQTWPKGLDPHGRPLLAGSAGATSGWPWRAAALESGSAGDRRRSG